MNRMRTILSLLPMILASACVSNPPVHDPNFSAVQPVYVDRDKSSNGSIYTADAPSRGYGLNLFEDYKAYRIGDLLTVSLVEQTSASKAASTSTDKAQEISTGTPTLLGLPVTRNGVEIMNNEVDSSQGFEGDASSSQSNSLTGSITVTVAEVYPNGNLLVRGEKVLSLNQGDEFIRFAGIVRPQDIDANNTVLSTKVADARVIYGGSGVLADANSMGWLARFFNKLWPF